MHIASLSHCFAGLLAASTLLAQGPGYTDTPILPSGWHVHDSARPRPPAVDPGPAPLVAMILST